jgi:ABC-type phosphate transport system substrate-binding protein
MKNLNKLTILGLLFLAVGTAHADVVAVVGAKSAVGALTKDQVADIFLGKTGTFPDGSQAVPIDQSSSSAQREEFYTKTTGRSGAQLKSYWAKQVFSGKGTAPKEVPGEDEVKKLIATNPNLIGYIERARVDATVRIVFTP